MYLRSFSILPYMNEYLFEYIMTCFVFELSYFHMDGVLKKVFISILGHLLWKKMSNNIIQLLSSRNKLFF